MGIDFLLKVFEENKENDAIIWRDEVYSYGWLLDRTAYWQKKITSQKINSGAVTALEADFSPNSAALLLALIEANCIIVPLAKAVKAKKSEFKKISQYEISYVIDKNDNIKVNRLANVANHELYQLLKTRRHPGLVLFSSGSTGKSKAALHDLADILEKYKTPRHKQRTITFLLYDHIGGLNTMLYTLSNGGCLITVQDRSPDRVLSAIEKHKVELLPTSPTFLNLILQSEAYKRYNLQSLKTISYGTEPMPESTLKRLHKLLPNIKLLQTYGLSEIGILRSKSKSSDSLWVKIGGEGFETRIVDGILQIKANSAMLGYLNRPSPFTEDGWFITGDAVEVDGDYIKILGRESEIINVGGEKVYPVEVESVLHMMDDVAEVIAGAELNPLIGNIVKVHVKLDNDETTSDFRKRMWSFCIDKLPKYSIPQKVVLAKKDMHSDRYKKMRRV